MPLRQQLSRHLVDTVSERDWSGLGNGDLIDIAGHEGYDVLVTADQNIRYQQNLAGRHLTVVILLSTSWPNIQLKIKRFALFSKRRAPGNSRESQYENGQRLARPIPLTPRASAPMPDRQTVSRKEARQLRVGKHLCAPTLLSPAIFVRSGLREGLQRQHAPGTLLGGAALSAYCRCRGASLLRDRPGRRRV